jgi:O-antigen ligase
MVDIIQNNRKLNILVCLSVCLFVVAGFISILSWLIFLPVIIMFFVYDTRHGRKYQQTVKKMYLDYAVYIICLVEIIGCITSIYMPNSITVTLKTLLLASFYFFVRTFMKHHTQYSVLYASIACLSGLLSFVTIIFFIVHRNKFYSIEFVDLTDFRYYYRPLGQLSNDWATILLCLFPFSLLSIFYTDVKWRKAGFILIAILTLTALLSSFSRGVYIAFSVFCILSILFVFLYRREAWRYFSFVLCSIVLASIVLLYPERKSILTTCSISKTTSQKRSIEGRFVKWNEAFTIFKHFPITGVGSGNYALASLHYMEEKQGELFTFRSTNTYLQLLTEKGMTGITTYGILFIICCSYGFKQAKRGEMSTIVLLTSFIALFVREMSFSSLFEKDMLLILFLLMVSNFVQPAEKERYELFT